MQPHDKKEYFLQNRFDGTERTFKAHDPSHEGGVTLRNAQVEEGQEMIAKEEEPPQAEDDEFRQQIEKETLDKILN